MFIGDRVVYVHVEVQVHVHDPRSVVTLVESVSMRSEWPIT